MLSSSQAPPPPPPPPNSYNRRCAVVGVGALGTSLCQQLLSFSGWEEENNWHVTGITKTSGNHGSIRSQVGGGDYHGGDRFRLVTWDEMIGDGERFQNVVFCAPPSGFEDYLAAVKEACSQYWMGPEGGGVFVFTSSGGMYVSTSRGNLGRKWVILRFSTLIVFL
jgi:hypothetical protein